MKRKVTESLNAWKSSTSRKPLILRGARQVGKTYSAVIRGEYMAENFVAQELRSSGVKTLYCWHGRTAEVEFLLEKEGEIIPVEVKSGWVTQSKS